MNSVVVHYQEIALKGRNRPWFIGRLASNLRVVTADVGVTAVRVLMGRIELVLDPTADWDEVKARDRANVRDREFFASRPSGARHRSDRGGHPAGAGRPGGGELQGVGPTSR